MRVPPLVTVLLLLSVCLSPASDEYIDVCLLQSSVEGCDAMLDPGMDTEVRAEVHFQTGFKLLRAGRCLDAVKHYQRATELMPGRILAHVRLGQSLECLESYEEAVAAYEKAMRLDTRHGGPVDRLTALLMQLGRLEEARDYLEADALRHPKKSTPLFRLAEIAEALGESDRAVEYFRDAIQVSPDTIDMMPTAEDARKMGWSKADLANWKRAVELEKAIQPR